MGSPITLSGFNNIDFNVVLEAIVAQERQPVTQLETQKRALEAQRSAFGTLASKLAALESAAEDLASASAFQGRAATVSDPTRLSVGSAGSAAPGTYEIYVQQLARAQVTTTSSVHTDKDTTIVASGGTLDIGGKTVTVSGDVTLQGLADAINGTSDIGVSATVVQNASGYQLVLTGSATGAANSFTVTNNLTGGSGVAFAATPTQAARDAAITINGVQATSSSNSFDAVIAGLSFTVLKEDLANSVTVTITADSNSLKTLVKTLVTAFNDLTKFASEQTAASGRGEDGSIGRDSAVRRLRSTLSGALTASYSTGGAFTSLAEIGFEFSRTGELQFNEATFDAAYASNRADLERLFTGTGGVFAALETEIERYTATGGLVPSAQTQIDGQVQKISTRISDLEARLEIRRAALQEEFIAADLAIAQLNTQKSSLGGLGGGYSLF